MAKTEEEIKKKSKNGDDFDLDDLDLDDLTEFEINVEEEQEDLYSDDRKPSPTSIAKEIIESETVPFLENIVKKAAAKTLPDTYTYNYYTVKNYYDEIENAIEENKPAIKKALYRLGKEINNFLPFKIGFIEKYVQQYQEENQQIREASQQELIENTIASSLNQIFEKQLSTEAQLEERKEIKEEEAKVQNLALNKLNLDALSSIDKNLSIQTQFTLNIAKEYYKKSLELQFRSYYVQLDLLNTIREYYKGFSVQLDAISKNTSLPDAIKLNNKEILLHLSKTKLIESFYENIYSDYSYFETIKDRFRKYIKSKVSDFTDVINQVADQLGQINDQSEGSFIHKVRFISGLLASAGFDVLSDKISDKIAPKVKEYIEQNPNLEEKVNLGANLITNLANSPVTFFTNLKENISEKLDSGELEDSPVKSILYKALNDMLQVTRFEFEPTMISSDISQLNKPAVYDIRTYTTINDIIPGYLSKILKENIELNNMYRIVNYSILRNREKEYQVEELRYDYLNRKLANKSEVFKTISEKVINRDNKNIETKRYVEGLLSAATKADEDIKKRLGSAFGKPKDKENFIKHVSSIIENKKVSNTEELLEELVSRESLNTLKQMFDGEAFQDLRVSLEYMLNDAKKNRKNKIFNFKVKQELNDKLTDIQTKIPTSAIKRFVETLPYILKPTGRRVASIRLKNDEATVLADSILNYMYNVKRSIIVPKDFLNVKLYSKIPADFIEKKDFDKIIKYIVNNVSKILNSEDMLKITHLENLVGSINKELLGVFDKSKSLFSRLEELYPEMFGDTRFIANGQTSGYRINYENYFGEFGNVQSVRYTSNDILNKIVREGKRRPDEEYKKYTEKRSAEDTVSYLTRFFSGDKTNTSKLGKKITEIHKKSGGDVLRTLKLIYADFNEIKNAVNEDIKNSYNEAKKAFSELSGKFNKIKDLASEQSRNLIIEAINETIKKVDKYIGEEEEAKNTMLNAISRSIMEMEKTINEGNSSPELLSKLEIERKRLNRLSSIYDKELEIGRKLRSRLDNIKDTIILSKDNQDETFLTTILENFNTLKSDITNWLEELDKKYAEEEKQSKEL